MMYRGFFASSVFGSIFQERIIGISLFASAIHGILIRSIEFSTQFETFRQIRIVVNVGSLIKQLSSSFVNSLIHECFIIWYHKVFVIIIIS